MSELLGFLISGNLLSNISCISSVSATENVVCIASATLAGSVTSTFSASSTVSTRITNPGGATPMVPTASSCPLCPI